jgi:hypothetical protein
MAHQIPQVCHGVTVALPLADISAVHGSQTSDVCGIGGLA